MKQKNNSYTLIILTSIIYEMLVYILGLYVNNSIVILIPLTLGYFSYIFVYTYKNKDKKNCLFWLIIAIGVFLRTIYIFKTDVTTRQHDVLAMHESGHLGYIYTLFTSYHLPLTNDWQFYHPPLWHILGAMWLFINSLFKVDINYAIEGIQILSLLLSSFMIIIADKICLKLKMNNKIRCLVLGLIAINPTLIRFSGSINNDCLLTFMEALVLLKLFDWYDDSNIKNTIKLAIVTGLCVMTKMNGAIMAVPIMYVFIKKLIEIIKKDKTKIKNYISKIVLFGMVSLPIGLWYQVRNLIKFGESKVPEPGDWLYTGNHSFISRFLTINTHQLFNYAVMSDDDNWISFIIRSGIFGEFEFNIKRWLFIMLIVLLCIFIIIFTLSVVCYLFKKKKNIYINTLIITWFVSIAASLIFYYKYPYACSMDYRYVAICLLCSNIFVGYMLKETKNKYLKYFIFLVCLLYIIFNIIFVIQID